MTSDKARGERRSQPRTPHAVPVEVHFERMRLLGPSANLSPEGVYFLAEGSIPVTVSVSIEGRRRAVKGRIVRVGSVNERTLGVAIQFETPIH